MKGVAAVAAKTAEKDALYRYYYKLKDETAKVEKIKRSVAEIMSAESPGRATKKYGELSCSPQSAGGVYTLPADR